MTVWLLALVLLASLAALGYRQGVIRVALSLIGIFAALWLTGPFAGLARKGLVAVGVKHATLLWLLAPLVVFVVVLTVFKIIGLMVHQRVAFYYKYKAPGLRAARWERLHRRLGLCLGLVNGTVYLVLISVVIYASSYWTVQMATSDEDSRGMRILNRMGWDLQRTGMARVAEAINPMPAVYYEVADLAGLIYHHPLLEARLSRYPAFLSLSERPDFQILGQDLKFADMRLKQEPVGNVLAYPPVRSILKNPNTLDLIWGIAEPDLQDLRTFLETGQSPKYDGEQILGRWTFELNGTVAIYRTVRPNLASSELQRIRKWMTVAFAKTSATAAADHIFWLKNVPSIKAQTSVAPANETRTLQGQWENAGGQYVLTFRSAGRTEEMKAQIEGDRMTIASEGSTVVFTRAD